MMASSDSEYQPTDEDLHILREWITKMPHIVQDYDDIFLATFVRGCKGSLQRAKIVLEKFNSLGFRNPYFFGHLDILDPTTQERLTDTMYFPMPKPLHDGTIIFIVTTDFKDRALSKKSNITEILRFWLMSFIVRAWENEAGGKCITIADWKGLSLSHAKEVTPQMLKSVIESFSCIPLRLLSMYNVNVPPALEWIFNTILSMMNQKIKERMYFTSSVETLYERIPREFLPKDYGGNQDDIKAIYSRWMKKIESYRDRLVEENTKMRKLDPLRPKKRDVAETFKALQVD